MPRTENTLVTKPMDATAFSNRGDTAVTWLGGAGFLVNSRGTVILIDPVLSLSPDKEGCSEAGLKLKTALPIQAQQVLRVDYVLYTHSDIDHLGPITALALAKKGAKFYGTYRVYHALTQLGVSPKQAFVCREDEPVQLGGIAVDVTPADHPWQLKDLKRGGRPFRAGECCGYILNTPDGRLFFPGDTRLMEAHLRIKNIDLLALDVSMCEYHLNHTSAAVLANNLPEAWLFPLHYGTYDSPQPAHLGDPCDVFKNVTDGDRRGLLLPPGEPFVLKKA